MRSLTAMRQLIPAITICWLISAPLSASTEAPEKDDAEISYAILLDMSGSMLEPLNGTPKFQMAQQAFRDLEAKFVGHANVSFTYFANGTDRQNDEKNCASASQVVRNGEIVTAEHMNTVVADLADAKGRKTNITHAIAFASRELQAQGGGKIILISDGNENCDRDPVEFAGGSQAAGVPIDTIGIGNAADFSELGRIALSGGGSFQLADSAASLAAALSGSTGMGSFAGAAPSAAVQAPPAALAMMTDELPVGQQAPSQPAPPTQPLVLEMDVSVAAAQKLPVAVEIILDVSGSMAGRLEGIPKINLARQALSEALAGLESDAFVVGFRAYGFDDSVAKTAEASCPNTELLNPLAANQVPRIRARVGALVPYGYTPLARSLALAGEDLLAIPSDKQMIILLTDGEESCGGDPQAVAANLREKGIDVEVHIVGFDLEVEEAAVMRDVAKAGGGAYYDAQDSAQLKEALKQVIEVTANKVDPSWLRTISPVKGGQTAEEALLVAPGTYTLTDHLPKGEEMFFRVNTVRGQHGVVRGLIQSRRLIRDGDGSVESDLGYAQYSIRLYEADGGKIGGRSVRLHGEPGSFGHVGFSDLVGDGFLFSISSNYDQVHKDALFNIDVTDASDQYVGQEAGSELDDATPQLEPDTTIIGHLGDGDRKDIYRVELPSGMAAVTVNLNFQAPGFASRLIVAGLSTGRKIQSVASRGDPYSLQIELPETESRGLAIEIRSNNPSLREKFSSYELSVTTGNSL